MSEQTRPEPGDSAIVEVVENKPPRVMLFQRDDMDDDDPCRWYSLVPAGSALPWEYLRGDAVVRWYRADDPEIAVVPAWSDRVVLEDQRGVATVVDLDEEWDGVRIVRGFFVLDAFEIELSREQAEQLGLALLSAARRSKGAVA
jgi:hypothetical protein